MVSKLLLLSLQAIVANAGFMDALGYPPTTRAPLPTGFVNPTKERRDINDCSTVYSAINYCESVSPGFTTMAVTNQAPCLCYSSTSWYPQWFDGAVSGCATYAKTASPTDYSVIAALNGFCTSVGDVFGSTSTTTSRGSSGGGSPAQPSACSVVAAAISYCESVSPGFTTMPVSSQAPCLCYSSTSWRPEIFDGVVKTCANFAKTASPSDYSVLHNFEGFCTSAGDVTKAPASASASTTRRTTPSDTITTPAPSLGTTGILANSACSYAIAAVSYCNSVSPGFTTMEPSSQAPCLCYLSATWNPTGFDGPVSTCAEYVKTAQPSDYNLYSNLAGFCTDVGDVFATTTSSSAAETKSAGSGGIGGPVGQLFSSSSTESTESSPTPRSTVTIQASQPAQTTSPNGAVFAVSMDRWALGLFLGTMGVFVWL